MQINNLIELGKAIEAHPGAVFVTVGGACITYDGVAMAWEGGGRCAINAADFPMTMVPAKPLRDVGKEPRVGDVVKWIGGNTRTVDAVTPKLVAYVYDDADETDGGARVFLRAEWAKLFSDGSLEVVSRAEAAND